MRDQTPREFNGRDTCWLLPIHRSQRIERTAHTAAADLQHMRVNHGRLHVGMPQQFLHRADVVAGLQHLGCKRVPQGMRRSRQMHLRQMQGTFERTLKRRFMRMMPPHNTGARIGRQRTVVDSVPSVFPR